jgi:hypothetical protein
MLRLAVEMPEDAVADGRWGFGNRKG